MNTPPLEHQVQINGELNPKSVWENCLLIIKNNINSQIFKTWFEPIVPLKLDGKVLTIQVPSQFFYEWLEERYYTLINQTLAQVLGEQAKLNYSIPQGENEPALSSTTTSDIHSYIQLANVAPPSFPNAPLANSVNHAAYSPVESYLNPRYTFDNFIKGDSNQLARAAALAVANNPGGTSFNPLVIYGGVGLGKTHVIQAIGNHVLQHDKTKRVIYASSEKFTVEFVDAIQSDKINEFSNFYRSMDLLIVDDIQFFAGKEKTQDSFFHTFNTLHQLGKQIILSSDKPPKELKGLNERLISRFQWGLTADIQPPDLETRIAILRKKNENDHIEIPEDVIEFIATNVTTNIRELEGCLISLLAKASLENKEINVDLAKEVLKTVVGDVKSHITIEDIQRMVCEYYEIAEDLIRAKTRKQEVVIARQVAMYLVKELTNSSLKTIGLHFGGRDHSTVIHAYQTVEDQMKTNPKFCSTVQQLKKKVELTSR